MKKRLILFFVAIGLIMAFAPTPATIDLHLIPVAPSISDSVWLLGHKKTTGVYTTYRFSMPQLASYLGAGTGLGNNFANADLDVQANRFHRFHKYGMTWDSVYYFNFVDSFGDTIFSFNNFYNPHNCIVRVVSYGNTGSFNVLTKDQHAGITVVSPSSSISNGTSIFQLVNPIGFGINFARIGVNGIYGFLQDSPTHTVYLGDWATNKGLQIDYTTGGVKVDNAYRLPTVDALSTDQYMTSNGSGIASWSTIAKLGLVTRYNGGAVAGNGIPAIRAHASGGGSTTAVTITSLTSSANVYEVGGYVNINSVTTDVLAFRVTYTDLGGIIHTQDMTPNGGTVTTLANVQHYFFPKVEIMPQLGSTISVRTVLTTGGGSINYDYSGTITQVD